MLSIFFQSILPPTNTQHTSHSIFYTFSFHAMLLLQRSCVHIRLKTLILLHLEPYASRTPHPMNLFFSTHTSPHLRFFAFIRYVFAYISVEEIYVQYYNNIGNTYHYILQRLWAFSIFLRQLGKKANERSKKRHIREKRKKNPRVDRVLNVYWTLFYVCSFSMFDEQCYHCYFGSRRFHLIH